MHAILGKREEKGEARKEKRRDNKPKKEQGREKKKTRGKLSFGLGICGTCVKKVNAKCGKFTQQFL